MARGAAQTAHVISLDPGWVLVQAPDQEKKILDFYKKKTSSKILLAFAAFEISGPRFPKSKAEVVALYREGKAHVTPEQRFVGLEDWLDEEAEKEVFTALRIQEVKKPLISWLPFFIFSRGDPIFDERLSYDRTQLMREICLRGTHNFVVLKDAFLVKVKGRHEAVLEDRVIQNKVLTELAQKYPGRRHCLIEE